MTLQKKESADWVYVSKKTHSELFSELDILLRAADRAFNTEYLTPEKENLIEGNFTDELSAVRDIILRILGILEVIIPESRKNAYWFQKFAETKLMTDSKRDIFREDLYKQNTQEKGLLLLYNSFVNLKGIITDILKTGDIAYLSFQNIGQLLSKEIRENNYFNPFRKNISQDFDVIDNHEISEIVKNIKEKEIKKNVSIALIYLFRFLRYLSHVDVTTQRTASLHTSLLILILLRSEINIFRNYIEKVISKITQPALKTLFQLLSYQFSMESKRVYLQELKDIFKKKAPRYFRGRTENSHGILKNLTEQSIIQIAQFYRPDLKGEDIFKSFLTKLEQSMKLREDIFILHKFLILFKENAYSKDRRLKIFEAMKNFILYFESFTFRLLRYEDYEEFVSFFKEVLSFKKEYITGGDIKKVLGTINNFIIFLETTLRHIANRSELNDKAIDISSADKIIKQYLNGS